MASADNSSNSIDSNAVKRLTEARQKLSEQLSQVIVGQEQVIEELFIYLYYL